VVVVEVRDFLSATSGPSAAELDARFFRGLADPCRVRILELLVDGEKNVSELVEHTGLAQNRVSTQLGCLRTCGFVSARHEGRFVYYQVTDPRVRELLRLARQVIADNATRILACRVVAQEGVG
jgi:DNA-binding transcriptional ArsR family regulator